MTREVHLLTFGNTRSAGPWRHPDIDNSTAGVRRRLIEHARTAEAGTLDALFFADGLNFGPPATWAYKTTEDFEPLTTAAALSLVTESIGLVVTGSATLQHPYHLARQFFGHDESRRRAQALRAALRVNRGAPGCDPRATRGWG